MQDSRVHGSRSTALSSLGWLLTILIPGIPLCLHYGAPRWIIIVLGVSVCFDVILYLFAYLYFMFKNPDALRSERFYLSKMALEKGLIGDSLSGLGKELRGDVKLISGAHGDDPEAIRK